MYRLTLSGILLSCCLLTAAAQEEAKDSITVTATASVRPGHDVNALARKNALELGVVSIVRTRRKAPGGRLIESYLKERAGEFVRQLKVLEETKKSYYVKLRASYAVDLAAYRKAWDNTGVLLKRAGMPAIKLVTKFTRDGKPADDALVRASLSNGLSKAGFVLVDDKAKAKVVLKITLTMTTQQRPLFRGSRQMRVRHTWSAASSAIRISDSVQLADKSSGWIANSDLRGDADRTYQQGVAAAGDIVPREIGGLLLGRWIRQ